MFVVAVAEAVVAHDIVLGVIVPGGREIAGGDAEAVGAPAAAAVRDALAELERARRALPVRIGGHEYWAR
ncbi:MAG: hypothetical protein ACFNXT_10425, partial [Actinomyces massiliensis]